MALAAALVGCGETDPEPVELLPPEVFTWIGGQPVSIAPPPESWERSRYQNGGLEGVDFVKVGSVGEQIFVAERLFVGNRDRCARVQEILDDLDKYDARTFRGAMAKAKLYADEPFNAQEERSIEVVNYTLDRAKKAFLADDLVTARDELNLANEQAGRIRFTIDETVDRALFTAEKNTVYRALQVDEPGAGRLADVPAVVVKFTFDSHRMPLIGRRIYAIKNNRMFEVGYQGLEENLPLFERVVDSITFPPGRCEH